MDTTAKICTLLDKTCVRLWTHGETTSPLQMEDSGYDERLIARDHSIVIGRERCDRLYDEWAASDYTLSFYEYAYADMIEGMLTDHGRMVRATNKINERIGKAPLQQKIEGLNCGY